MDPGHDGEDGEATGTAAGLVIAAVLIAVAVFLLIKFKQSNDLEDCIAARHRDCVPTDTGQ